MRSLYPLLTRRQALGSLSVAAIYASFGIPARSNAQSVGSEDRLATADHFLIRGGQALTFDSSIGDLPSGSVLIRGGEIIAVAEQIDAGEAVVIDATDCVVMPGFVETHWHMWNSIWRGIIADASAYFRMSSLAEHYTVEDFEYCRARRCRRSRWLCRRPKGRFASYRHRGRVSHAGTGHLSRIQFDEAGNERRRELLLTSSAQRHPRRAAKPGRLSLSVDGRG